MALQLTAARRLESSRASRLKAISAKVGMGHEDAFPPTTLSNRFRLGKPTSAAMHLDDEVAPKQSSAESSKSVGF